MKSMTFNHSNANVEIYTWGTCGYCIRAKRLLSDKNIVFVEYAIDGDAQARRQMMERADGRRSMPQIFINDQGIGGYFELRQLEDEGRLDNMLSGRAGEGESGDQGWP